MKERKTKWITPEEYATTMIAQKGKYKGDHVSVTYIHWLIKEKKLPLNVYDIKEHSRFHLLEVAENLHIGEYNPKRKKPSLSTK